MPENNTAFDNMKAFRDFMQKVDWQNRSILNRPKYPPASVFYWVPARFWDIYLRDRIN